MILRPRQKEFVEKCDAALEKFGNTLGVAPTGAGKTVMLSALAGRAACSLILQHRAELVDQNRATFKRFNPRVQTDVWTANRKRFAPNGATFAMVQTLMRDGSLAKMKPVELLVVDECHHIAADSYKKIVGRARELNPAIKIFGVTATPMRGDKRALRETFDNVADVISLTELIQGGFLVRPRTYVIDCGLREDLKRVRVTANDFDMDEVSKIMDKFAVNQKVLEEWRRLASDRQTVIFCSTVDHAVNVAQTFTEAGIKTEVVTGAMGDSDREATLARFDRREIQVVVNVAVLTEGWDCQPVSCVVLLRPCSFKNTMIQMIGRGLRKVDPERYPGVHKDDALILDFGYSLLTHGSLETDIELDPKKRDAKQEPCPECGTLIPASVRFCPVCGAEINPASEDGEGEGSEREALTDFRMTEIELLDVSPYRWEDFWDGIVTIANGLKAWACLIFYHGRWMVVAAIDREPLRVLGDTPERIQALATADDFLREHGDRSNARKSRSWLSLPPTDKQLAMLNMSPAEAFGFNRYRASCQLTWKFNERAIRTKLLQANENL